MNKRLKIGTSDFRNTIEANGYYVDKTLLIKEVIDSEHEVLLFPRPRRFGKTLNLSMLRYFFDLNQKNTAALFTDLKIWQEEEKYRSMQGKYPVIYLTLKDIKNESFDEFVSSIKYLIIKLFEEHDYLLNSEVLRASEKMRYEQIISEKESTKIYENSLKDLSDYLYRFHNKKVVILIDEYDTPIHTAFYYNYYDKVISFMRNFLSAAFKDNVYLYKGVITGILRVSRESIFSGLNNLGVYSILSYHFSDKFGFTETETKDLLTYFKLIDNYEDIKKWYNGYKFGDTENIYNPWSIVNYVAKSAEGCQAHWVNTSSDELIRNRITEKNAESIRQDIEKLIKGETLSKILDENIVFANLDSEKELLWSLLTFSGYLTILKQEGDFHYIKIPNYEIQTLYRMIILDWLNISVKFSKSLLYETTTNLLENKIVEFEKNFKRLLGDTLSYFDISNEAEKIYHAYMLGMLAITRGEYLVKSNRESGDGRYDILLMPLESDKYGVVIEIKTLTKEATKEQIDAKLTEALAQISENEYYKELIDNNIGKRIELGIVFAGKNIAVRANSK